MKPNAYAQAQNYRQIDLAAEVEQASPHRLVALLFEGFLTHVAKAKVALQSNNYELKARNVQLAMNILVGLKGGLSEDASPDLANRLYELYDYCERRLLDASARRDAAGFDEVDGLIRQIKEAWDAIGASEDVHQIESAVA